MFKIVFLKKAEKDLKKITQNEVRRIFTKISTDLSDNPGKHKELKGNSGIFSYRVGSYRIIYSIENDTIVISKVDHRKDVYQ